MIKGSRKLPTRRQALLASGAMLLGGAAVAGAGTARLHATPKRKPFLTDAHLASLAETDAATPRVLFVGNSMVLNNDLPNVVRDLAAKEGLALTTATAAAWGARLIETVRISAFADALAVGWDVIVVQDFTKTPLRAIDRWGAAWAVAHIARTAAPAQILLYPPWPAADGNVVYEDPGFLTARPDGPADFARRTMDHYDGLKHPVLPVPHAWLAAIEGGQTLYAEDGHHPNPQGTAFVAQIIWDRLKELL